MQNDQNGKSGELRGIRGGVVFFTALLMPLAAGCAGGGGEDGGGGGGGIVPKVLTFSMGTGATPLTLEYAGSDIDVTMAISGSYGLDTDEWGNDVGTTLAIDSGSLFGMLDVTVFAALSGAAWDRPQSGTVDIRQASTGDLISVAVNAAAGGVDLFYDDGGDGQNVLGPFTYTWEELFDLFGSSPAEYEEIASFVWSVVELARERFLVVFEVFVAIFDLQEFLEGIGPEGNVEIPNACGSLPGSGKFGNGYFIWHDVDLGGLVDTGDAFTVILEDCWVDSPGRFDTLFDGMLELSAFSSTEVPFSTGADVEFQDLMKRMTEEVGGVYSILPGTDTITRGDTSVFFD